MPYDAGDWTIGERCCCVFGDGGRELADGVVGETVRGMVLGRLLAFFGAMGGLNASVNFSPVIKGWSLACWGDQRSIGLRLRSPWRKSTNALRFCISTESSSSKQKGVPNISLLRFHPQRHILQQPKPTSIDLLL